MKILTLFLSFALSQEYFWLRFLYFLNNHDYRIQWCSSTIDLLCMNKLFDMFLLDVRHQVLLLNHLFVVLSYLRYLRVFHIFCRDTNLLLYLLSWNSLYTVLNYFLLFFVSLLCIQLHMNYLFCLLISGVLPQYGENYIYWYIQLPR